MTLLDCQIVLGITPITPDLLLLNVDYDVIVIDRNQQPVIPRIIRQMIKMLNGSQ